MERLYFNNQVEFETYAKKSKKEITDAIIESIERALDSNRKTSKVLEASVGSFDFFYEVTLKQSQWVNALSACLSYYHAHSKDVDRTIEIWELLQKVKNLEK